MVLWTENLQKQGEIYSFHMFKTPKKQANYEKEPTKAWKGIQNPTREKATE